MPDSPSLELDGNLAFTIVVVAAMASGAAHMGDLYGKGATPPPFPGIGLAVNYLSPGPPVPPGCAAIQVSYLQAASTTIGGYADGLFACTPGRSTATCSRFA
jgi:hypothetical protein